MAELGRRPDALFLGQAVAYPGTAMTTTLRDVPPEKLIELPVIEDAQLGFCTGLSLAGYLPISIYPRWNFLLLATSQLVLHLDKLGLYSRYFPRVIVRTAVATAQPLDPGPQHVGNYTAAYRAMLETVEVVELTTAEQVLPAYRRAANRAWSTLIVERTELY